MKEFHAEWIKHTQSSLWQQNETPQNTSPLHTWFWLAIISQYPFKWRAFHMCQSCQCDIHSRKAADNTACMRTLASVKQQLHALSQGPVLCLHEWSTLWCSHWCMWGAKHGPEDFCLIFKTTKKWFLSYYCETHKNLITWILQSGTWLILQDILILALHMLWWTNAHNTSNKKGSWKPVSLSKQTLQSACDMWNNNACKVALG